MEKNRMDTISRKIAQFAIDLKYEDLPEEVIYQVKRYLFDSIGCAFGAMKTKDVNAVYKIYREMGGKPESTVIGFGDKLPAVNTTLINSLMIRALDFNDIYWKEDPSHPSDLIPAALAVAERQSKSARDAIVAIVLAYEFEQRMCEFAVPGVRERKWHHATITQFVSPIVAGKLLDLNEDQMVNAIGINGCHNHTIGCPTAGKLTMMKNTVDPMSVQTGVFAALMAKEGYIGTEAIFEGKEGLMDVFGPDWDEEKLVSGLGVKFKILECSMKAFPTEALTHTHLTATLKLVKENDIKPEEIEEVVVTTIARACDILFDPHKYKPESRETADHSLPYCIAASIVDRQITTNSFSDEKLKAPKIQAVINKIRGDASVEFEKMFPAKQPSKFISRTNKGEEFSQYLEYPKGDPREPMTDEDIAVKFNALSSKVLNSERQKEIRDAIFNFERIYSMKDFMEMLTI
ncbi:MAG: MmgE/PrpD family protein [Candidatus Neomarinimicrobiota bacterium]|nr:MAG: MmgE/PrpD family protein [Candidatus Neomarinimicrobiota bacterium]